LEFGDAGQEDHLSLPFLFLFYSLLNANDIIVKVLKLASRLANAVLRNFVQGKV
jgi:hypothetical protein